MKQNKHDLDAIIDKVTQGIREEAIDDAAIERAAAKAWERVSRHAAENSLAVDPYSEGINTMNINNNTEHIRGCDDFQSLMPDYLEGKLSNARRLLLEDHSSECIPCRNELKAQKAFAAAKSATFVAPQSTRLNTGAAKRAAGKSWTRNGFARAGLAAVLMICVGIAGLFLYERVDISGTTLAATVENANGSVYVVSESETRPLSVGEQLKKGETVRTAKDSAALLKLADGSTIEMRERSEFSVSENMRGVTVQLDRGDVIVEAAKQHNSRLYVQTPDSLVSVKGTIFGVESGIKGSRVSVVEGEVKVNHAGKEETLLPGDQTTTSPGLEKTTVHQNVAWSRNAARYASLVSELTKLRKEVNQKVARPGVRNASRFLDLVPENTVFYAALPNLSDSLAQSQQIMQERIKQNPALAEWWKGNHEGVNSQMMKRIHEFGSQLGDEIVVAGEMNAKGEPGGILVLSEVKDPAAFRGYVDSQLSRIASEVGDMPKVRVIDDPMTAKSAPAPAAGKKAAEELFVWIGNDIFAASPQLDTLRGLATAVRTPGANKFAGSAFRQRINDVYSNGAGIVVAADLEKIVAKVAEQNTKPEDSRHIEGLRQLGVMNLRHFVAEQKDVQGKTFTSAALTFSEANRGIASWLAAPGSMGALDFISPNANVTAAFVVKEPALLVDDLLVFMETVEPDVRRQMKEIETQQGFSIRDDFAAPLGGEFAFAIDGPILPTPSWKIVLEVYDQARLQQTFERAVEKLNQFSIVHGKGKLAIESAASGSQTYYTIKSAGVGAEVHYTYSNGYLIAAPTRALLEQSMRNRDAGNTLVRSPRFRSALPQDGNTNFSAILYHDLAPLMGPLAEKLKNASEGQELPSIDPNAPPTLAYVYAQGDRITLAANTEGGPFGISPASLLGMPNSFEMQHILSNAMGSEGKQK